MEQSTPSERFIERLCYDESAKISDAPYLTVSAELFDQVIAHLQQAAQPDLSPEAVADHVLTALDMLQTFKRVSYQEHVLSKRLKG